MTIKTSSNSKNKTSQPRSGLSFRFRLILATLLITFLAVIVMGVYIYYRAQQTNDYLTQQLDSTVRQQAQADLQKTSASQIKTLNDFFLSLRKEITDLGGMTGKMLSNEPVLNAGVYWDATKSLSRLPSGNWDNPATDISSVFIPAAVNLSPALKSELNTLAQLDFSAPIVLKSNPDTVAIYFGGLEGQVLYYPNVDLAALVPPDFNATKRPWFSIAVEAQNPGKGAVWSAPYLDAASNGLVITTSIPVFDGTGKFRGVEAMDIQLNRITDIVSQIKVGTTGHAFLIDKDKRLIAFPKAAYTDFGITAETYPLGNTLDEKVLASTKSPRLMEIVNRMSGGNSGLETITVNGVESFVIYNPISEVGYNLAIVVPTQELLAGVTEARAQINATTQSSLLVGVILVVILLVVSFIFTVWLANQLLKPLKALNSVADEISKGNLDVTAKSESQDEIGTLATTFNQMLGQLRQSFTTLEGRVLERTQSLELAAEVGRSVSQVRALDVMLKDATELIRSRFNLYYVQVYLVDPSKTNLVLQSGTGTVGAQLVERGHRLHLNTASINGRAAIEKRSVVVADTAASATFKPNPLLPLTRSEMAVPLFSGDTVIGVLDLQSQQAGALNQEVLSAFEALAGQLAVTIQNATFLAETQQARAEVEAQARHLSRANWVDYLDAIHQPEEIGYKFEQNKISHLTQAEQTQSAENTSALVAPISVTGETLGNLVVELAGQSPIARTDELVNAVARQVAQQIESLRLLDSAERFRREAEQASRRLTRESWKEFADANAADNLSYIYDLKSVRPYNQVADQLTEEAGFSLPLKVRDEMIGKLSIQGLNPDDKESLDLVNAVAERLGSHIESLRQQDQTQSALSQTEKLSVASLRLTQAEDLQEVLKVVDETLAIPVINRAWLGVFNFNADNELEDMTIVANWWNDTGHKPSEIGQRYTKETLNSLSYFTSKTPVFTDDTFNDERVNGVSLQICLQQNIHAMVILPLFIGSRQVGVMTLQSEEVYNFTPTNTRLFIAMSPQIATVLENRRQFERAQKQAERQSTLNIISQKIQGATTVEAVLQIAARELGHALGAPRTIAQLSIKDKK